ncbi:MAG: LacI family transcriptional regulator [Synergistaceae bacterium]|jgi:LacI family transcriptional regulator|nr:LacI family transcriptional regulator [Synergistaceae bacterium]
MTTKATLKDIAEAMGVTSTTVHRALKGKDGVSEKMRQTIRELAAKMGYRSNYLASALKRKSIRIAIVLPEPVDDNKYYYGRMWRGVRDFLAEVSEFPIAPIERTYSFVYGANGAALESLCQNHIGKLDGLITMGVDQGQSLYFVEKFIERGVPIVYVGSDISRGGRFCCVKSCDEMAGSLAAELLTAFHEDKTRRKVILLGHSGQLGMTDQIHNAAGFDAYIRENAPYLTLIQLRGAGHLEVCRELEQTLRSVEGVYAIYSCSARHTVYMLRVIEDLGMKGKLKLIGNDSFEESLNALERGELTAIIDKKIARQSYLAVKTLFDYIVKSEYPPSAQLQLKPEVILRSNLKKHFLSAVESPGNQLAHGEILSPNFKVR